MQCGRFRRCLERVLQVYMDYIARLRVRPQPLLLYTQTCCCTPRPVVVHTPVSTSLYLFRRVYTCFDESIPAPQLPGLCRMPCCVCLLLILVCV
jgi:hypothetical protein